MIAICQACHTVKHSCRRYGNDYKEYRTLCFLCHHLETVLKEMRK